MTKLLSIMAFYGCEFAQSSSKVQKSIIHEHPNNDPLRCIVLVSLSEDAKVVDKRLKSKHHPLHPGHPRLEEPDQLVEVVARDLLRLVQQEN